MDGFCREDSCSAPIASRSFAGSASNVLLANCWTSLRTTAGYSFTKEGGKQNGSLLPRGGIQRNVRKVMYNMCNVYQELKNVLTATQPRSFFHWRVKTTAYLADEPFVK